MRVSSDSEQSVRAAERHIAAQDRRMSSSTEVAPEPPVTNHVNEEAAQYADDGDGDFIPVVKEKRKSKAAEKQGSGGGGAATGDKPSGAAKSGGKSGHGSSRRRGRRSAASAAAAAAAAGTGGGGSGGESGHPEAGGGSDNGTADEHSNDDNPKKFVEAPIPAVNVWKVGRGRDWGRECRQKRKYIIA